MTKYLNNIVLKYLNHIELFLYMTLIIHEGFKLAYKDVYKITRQEI